MRHIGCGRFITRLACLVIATGIAAGQSTSDLATKADEQIKASGIQGSVLIAKGGKVILAKGYRLANIELDVPNKPETKFRLGSITKQFTSTAILQLQERGKLKVTDLISKHLSDTPAEWSKIAIHHLLTHTSGIHSYTDGREYPQHMREKSGEPLEFIKRVYSLPLDFEPGTKFHYDNSGYYLLGVIIERVSGMKYEDYLRKNIFDPLEMNDSGYDWPETILKNRASGYAKSRAGKVTNAEFLDMGQPYAAGSLYSTVLDLYKWDRALYTTKVLSRESIEAAFTPHEFEMGPGIKYGYGWGVSQINGHKAVGHGGGINGFSTVIWRAIEEDAVSIVLTNQEDGRLTGKLGQDLLQMLVGSK